MELFDLSRQLKNEAGYGVKIRLDIKMRPDIMTGYNETRTSFSPHFQALVCEKFSNLVEYFLALLGLKFVVTLADFLSGNCPETG